MTITWKHLFLCWLGGVLALAAPAERVSGFAELPEGDQLVVRYGSAGCFHFFETTLTYSRSGDGVIEMAQPPGAAPLHAPRLALKPGEMGKLDDLLALYRAKPEGRWSTVDTIVLEQLREGEVIARESFRDRSGATARAHRQWLTFWDVSLRILDSQGWGEKTDDALRLTFWGERVAKRGPHFLKLGATALDLVVQAEFARQRGDTLLISRREKGGSYRSKDYKIDATDEKKLAAFALQAEDQVHVDAARRK